MIRSPDGREQGRAVGAADEYQGSGGTHQLDHQDQLLAISRAEFAAEHLPAGPCMESSTPSGSL